jgi:hypothetical protein
MEILWIALIVVAIIALSGWGYGTYYAARPVAVADAAPAPAGTSPLITMIGVIGLIALVAFVVMWATGWRFGFEALPPR